MNPIVKNGKRSDSDGAKTGASISLGRLNYDWCVQEATREMVSLSSFIDEMITVRRIKIEEQRMKKGVVIDTRNTH